MSKKSKSSEDGKPIALAALKRAAKEAYELAVRTKTPLWVMRDGNIVDATKVPWKANKKKSVE